MSPAPKARPVEARIVSDGSPQGTRVYLGPADQELANVQHVTWDLDVGDAFATATITLGLVEVDLVGHARMHPGPSPDPRDGGSKHPRTERHRPST